MKSTKWTEIIGALLLPALLALLGLVLVINPNAASALISKVLGWLCLGGGLVSAIVTITGWPAKRVGRLILTLALLALGGYLVRHPLALAANLGKLLGIILLIQGAVNLLDSRGGSVLAVITALVGLFLLLFPLTLSQLVFRIIGAVMIGLGVSSILSRLWVLKYLNEPEDPDIIDAL